MAVCPAAHLFGQHPASRDLGFGRKSALKDSRKSCHVGQSVSCSRFGNPGLSLKRYE